MANWLWARTYSQYHTLDLGILEGDPREVGSNVGMMHYQALLLDQPHICFFLSFLKACTTTSRLPHTFFCKTSAINPASLLADSNAAEPLLDCLQVTAVQLMRPDLTDACGQPHLTLCAPLIDFCMLSHAPYFQIFA